MLNIFLVSMLAVSFCFGAFAQNASDVQSHNTNNASESLNNDGGSTEAVNAENKDMSASAQDAAEMPEDAVEQSDFIYNHYHEFYVGMGSSYIRYREPGNMKEAGILYGIMAKYFFLGVKHWRFGIDYNGGWGNMKYDSVDSGSINRVRDALCETRGTAGYVIDISGASLVPYLGVGYRYLSDDSSNKISNEGYSGYRRESNYIYLPLGADLNCPLGEGWSAGGTLEGDIFLYGRQISYLSDVDPAAPDIHNTQRRGFGARAAVHIACDLVRSYTLMVEPFVRYWNIAKSNTVYFTYNNTEWEGYEPKNNSLEIGCNIILKF